MKIKEEEPEEPREEALDEKEILSKVVILNH